MIFQLLYSLRLLKMPDTPIGSYWANDKDPFKKTIVKVLAEKERYIQFSMDCYKWDEEKSGWLKYSTTGIFQEESQTKEFFVSYYKPFEEKVIEGYIDSVSKKIKDTVVWEE
jgi:hypothetical protein